MEKVRLCDVCDFQGGSQPPKNEWSFEQKDGYIRMLQIRDFTQTRNVEKEYIKLTSSTKTCVTEDILIARYGASIGKILTGLSGAYNVAIMKTIPNEGILNKSYLKYYLLSNYFQNGINSVGARAAQAGFNKEDLSKLYIPVVSLVQQKLIVDKLNKLTTFIGKRKTQLEKLDELVKSRFIEMFGNEIYPVTPLINLIKEGAGLSYGIVQPGNDGTGDMGILRPVDMVDGKISAASIKYISRDIGDSFKKTELTGDELLITVRGTTGITALTDGRFVGMNVTRGIAVIRYDRRKINPIYLKTYLNTDKSQRYIQEHTRGATLQQINLSDLRIQEIPVPPMTRQEKMAAFVEQVDKSKFEIKQSLEKLELLKKALMQKYFG